MSNNLYRISVRSGRYSNDYSRRIGKLSTSFKSSGGYTPLLEIFQDYNGGFNDLIGLKRAFPGRNTIDAITDFGKLFNSYIFYREPYRKMAITLFSILGQTIDVDEHEIPLQIRRSGIDINFCQNFLNLNTVDVISLAVIRSEDISEGVRVVEPEDEFHIDIDKIKVLVSKRKFKSPSYMEEKYSRSLRTALVRKYNILKREIGLTIEVVDDSKLREFYDESPYFINGLDSILEANRIVSEIKDKAFDEVFNYLKV